MPNKTGEFERGAVDVDEMGEDFIEDEGGDGTVQAVAEGSGERTVQVEDSANIAAKDPDSSGRVRERRATLVSPIPAMLAASMTALVEPKAPAVPTPLPGKLAAAVKPAPAPAPAGGTAGYTVEVGATPADSLSHVNDLVAAARMAFEVRDLHAAARMAEEALSAGDAASTPEAQELVAANRALFDKMFSAFVGPMTATPSLIVPWEQIIAHRLTGSMRSFLNRVDGVRTLEQTLGHSSISPDSALRIAASALRAGFIRVA